MSSSLSREGLKVLEVLGLDGPATGSGDGAGTAGVSLESPWDMVGEGGSLLTKMSWPKILCPGPSPDHRYKRSRHWTKKERKKMIQFALKTAEKFKTLHAEGCVNSKEKVPWQKRLHVFLEMNFLEQKLESFSFLVAE